MDPLSPDRLPELREKLGWSAQQLGEFIGKDTDTIYQWEKGHVKADPVVMAVLTLLGRELDRRRAAWSPQAVNTWINQLETRGIRAFFQSLQDRSREMSNQALRQLVRRAQEQGTLVISVGPPQPDLLVLSLQDRSRRSLQANGDPEASRA